MRILIAEDDPAIAAAISGALRHGGHAVDHVASGAQADVALRDAAHDLLVLDLGLPGLDGSEVLHRLRQRGSGLPVLVITAREGLNERVRVLDLGADDYLVKPFSLEELAARIRALLRRHTGRAAPQIRVGALTLDPATREVTFRGKPVTLSAREYALLEALVARPGAVLSRAQLEDKLYGWNEEVESNTVEVYIHSLRRKLDQDLIKNVRGVGYMVPKPA